MENKKLNSNYHYVLIYSIYDYETNREQTNKMEIYDTLEEVDDWISNYNKEMNGKRRLTDYEIRVANDWTWKKGDRN